MRSRSTPGVSARITVRRAKEPLSQGFSRATRRGGLVIRSGRAAHETTLAGFEGRPGARHLYGEVVCEAIEQLQRDALDTPRPELVVKVDRSGLNQHHPIVERLYAAIDRVLRPIVAAEERRAGAHLIGAARAVTARDQVGLRALNDLLKAAFDQPGSAGAQPGTAPASKPPTATRRQRVGCGGRPRVRRVGDGAFRRRRRRSRRRCGSSSHLSGFTPARSGPSPCTPTRRPFPPGASSRWRPTPDCR